MADYPHSYKTIPEILDSGKEKWKIWSHSPFKQRYIEENPDSFKYYEDQLLSIDDLIKDNDLDNPVALNNHAETWSPTGSEDDIHPDQFKYEQSKDSNPAEIINGTRKLDGTVRLNDGRHRVRALKNAGYTHVRIPVKDQIFDIDDALREDYYTNKDPYALGGIARALPYFLQSDPKTIKRLQQLFRAKARYLRNEKF